MTIKINEYLEDFDDSRDTIQRVKVEKALETLRTIKEQEDMLKEMKAGAKEVIEEFYFATGAKNFQVEGIGKCAVWLGSSSKFDKKKFKTYLVKKGVDAQLVAAGFKTATTTKINGSVTVKFTAE